MAGPVVATAQADRLPARRLPAARRRLRRAEAALARPRLLVALLAVYVPFFVVYFASPIAFSLPHAAAACHGQPILDQRWGYSPQEVADYLQACGGVGRAAITAQQAADLVYPALFAAVLTVGLALLLRAVRVPERHWVHALVLLPAISAGADYLENAGIRTLLATFPRQPAIVPAVSAVTTVKLATGWACRACSWCSPPPPDPDGPRAGHPPECPGSGPAGAPAGGRGSRDRSTAASRAAAAVTTTARPSPHGPDSGRNSPHDAAGHPRQLQHGLRACEGAGAPRLLDVGLDDGVEPELAESGRDARRERDRGHRERP